MDLALGGIAGFIFAGFIFGGFICAGLIVPARRAARLAPAEALRST